MALNTVLRTAAFDRWLSKLGDHQGKARIIERIRSAERQYFRDCVFVGDGVAEMRIHFGPGYRIYFCRTDDNAYVLLCGGTKSGQRRDIARAKSIATRLKRD